MLWATTLLRCGLALSTTEESETQGRVTDAVARVNSRFSTLTYQPIVFLPTPDLTFSQYLGLLTDLHNHVIAQTAQKFVSSFLTRCLRVHVEHQQQADPSTDVSPLDLSLVVPRFRHSRRRLLLVDLEGCLWIRDSDPRVRMTESPPQEVFDILSKLTEDNRNEVWILSGLQVKGVLENLAEVIPRLGIWHVFQIAHKELTSSS